MSAKDPKYDIKRGRHRKRASRETADWKGSGPGSSPPPVPPWMDAETAAKLRALRDEVDPWKRAAG